jgi:hypothetical protein
MSRQISYSSRNGAVGGASYEMIVLSFFLALTHLQLHGARYRAYVRVIVLVDS